MQIKVAPHAGTCFGVNNAIKIAFSAAKNKKNLYILGELVHNPQVVAELESLGVKAVDDVTQLKQGDNLIIRAHGEKKDTYEYCQKNNINVIDCTCPYVKRAQNIAQNLDLAGYKVVIVGESDHPEVKGIAAQASSPIIVSGKGQVLDKALSKVGILAQTTKKRENFSEIVAELASQTKELKIYNTICGATTNRQDAAKKLCGEVDAIVVIGGRNSANTKRLYEICSECVKTYWISSPGELQAAWFNDYEKVGVTAGASTPLSAIEKTLRKLSSFGKTI